MAVYHFTAPLSAEDVLKLSVGDSVYVSGKSFTCRSRLHRYVLDEGNPFPFDDKDCNVLIHTGLIIIREDGRWKLVSFMPTSSLRFEKWGYRSIKEWGLRMIIGKTTMGEETAKAMAEYKCVHVSPNSVSPNIWCDSIKVDDVHLFDELGSIEATWHLTLNELGPFVVDMDCFGGNLYKSLEDSVNRNRAEVLNSLGIGEDFKYTKLY